MPSSSSVSSHISSASSSVHTNSALVSASVVAASSVSATHSSSDKNNSTKKHKNAAPGMVANPISWKYGFAMGAAIVGSFVLGSNI